jgi:single-strand DNA-binding protein
MRGVNAVTLMGNTGGDPEVKYTTDGGAVATFNIAISEKFKTKSSGELKERTDWFKVVCFSQLAETIGKWVGKGDKLLVWGSLRKREWTTPEGDKRSSIEVVANRVDFINLKRKEGAADDGHQGPGPEDDVPF